MNQLLTIFGPIFLQIEWRDIRYFLLGAATGLILVTLSVAWLLTSKERKKTKIRISKGVPLDDKAVMEMIDAKQKQLENTVRITDNGYFKVALDLSFELSQEIARYYFPDSRYPLYELSIQELLTLNYYITKRFDELMNGKFFKLFKNYRISSIIDLLNTKKKINNSKLMQITRKIKLQQIYSASRAVLNYANPIYWFRKLAIKPTTVLVTKEICKYIIMIFGEETNKIYSKAIFNQEDNEDEIMNQMEKLIESEGEE
ncbi:MAG TPA: hypothetical protein PKU69_01355 [Bacillota bacterium]|nr:hypothetical protein [Bacillota bacterium]HPJ23415.1 hypothetical protein [Bacillota bacterium]